MALKRAPIFGRNVCLTFYGFLYIVSAIDNLNVKIKRIRPNAKIT